MDSESHFFAVKTAKNLECGELIRREKAILKSLKHPLVIELRPLTPKPPGQNPSLVTKFAGNGSLAGLLASDDRLRLCEPNLIAKVIAGTALAMRFVHRKCVQHRDLSPDNILIDWDWTVRIADFGLSASPEAELPIRGGGFGSWSLVNSRYLAPECYEGNFVRASDVFAFAMILFEVLTGRSAFPENLRSKQIAFLVAVEGWQPEIPDSVVPPMAELIADCWETDPDDRPTFAEIVDRLAEMDFRVTADVDSAKVAEFVKRIEEWEGENSRE